MKANDIVLILPLKELGRITAIKGGRAHVSNMNQPFCGSVCQWFKLDELKVFGSEHYHCAGVAFKSGE